jgi:cytochrome P450
MDDQAPREFDPFSPSFVRNPYPLLAAMREERAIHHVRQPNRIERYVVTRHAEGRGVLTDKRFSADPEYGREALQRAGYLQPGSRSGVSDASLLTTDPPVHTRLRRLLSRAFEAGPIDRLTPVIESNIARLVQTIRLDASSKVDLVAQFAHPLTIRTLCEILGIDEEGSANFTGWINDVMAPRHRPNANAIRATADEAIRAYLADLIRTKDGRADDLSSRLVGQWRDDPSQVSEAELTNMLYELILAGYLTTAGLIVNGMLALLENPVELARLRSTPAMGTNAVEELLRFDGPAFSSSLRFATQDVVIAGTPIPAGSLVSVLFAAANRDGRSYSDPDRLDLGRPNAMTHLGFSHGIHLCWGAPVARLEARLAIGALVDRFDSIRLVGDRESIEWSAVGNSRSPVALDVVLEPQAMS